MPVPAVIKAFGIFVEYIYIHNCFGHEAFPRAGVSVVSKHED